jgi:hypothetical protein
MTRYEGNVPFTNLTAKQAASIAFAVSFAPPDIRDGVWRSVYTQALLFGPGPWTDPQIRDIIPVGLWQSGIISAALGLFVMNGDSVGLLSGGSSLQVSL